MNIEIVKTIEGSYCLWDGPHYLADCGKGVEGEERAKAVWDEIMNLQVANSELLAERNRLTSERDEARTILAEIAHATAEQGFLFMDEKGHDDWPAAVAWLKQHIGLTPEQSMLEQHQEAINNWRAYARAYQADNAALFDAIYDWSRYHSAGEGKEEDALLAALAASHPGAPFLALLSVARAYRDAWHGNMEMGPLAIGEHWDRLRSAIDAMDGEKT